MKIKNLLPRPKYIIRLDDASHFSDLSKWNKIASILATRWSVVKAGSLFGSKTSFIEMTSKDSLQIKESNFKK